MICLNRTPSRTIRSFVLFKIFFKHLIFRCHLICRKHRFFILYHKPLFFLSKPVYTSLTSTSGLIYNRSLQGRGS